MRQFSPGERVTLPEKRLVEQLGKSYKRTYGTVKFQDGPFVVVEVVSFTKKEPKTARFMVQELEPVQPR
jgi:CRISPR/Cas system CSM-associated protein Csm3 (group 7 of RAMP superfamily)